MISDEAIEAIVELLAARDYPAYMPDPEWAREVLEAAAPHMMSAAWDDGHSAGIDHADGLDGGSNPYDRTTP